MNERRPSGPSRARWERCCVCERGDGIVIASGAEVCEPCVIGTYKEVRGNIRCEACKSEQWTTAQLGSKLADQCVCDIGFYRAPTLNTTVGNKGLTTSSGVDQSTMYDNWARLRLDTRIMVEPGEWGIVGDISYDCYPCEDTWFNVLDATNCTYIGVDCANTALCWRF